MVSAASLIHAHNARQMPVYRGSMRGRSGNAKRNRAGGHNGLSKYYSHLSDMVNMEFMFQHCYRMSRDLFLIILRGVREYNSIFRCRPDATSKLGFTSYEKCYAAIHMLSYRVPGDVFGEYLRMSETTCLESIYRFCRAVIAVFNKLY
ncbi:uncharacterized protein [Lolium perenne]|uniref:uncharacterized protein n=1 Tax=Lolium perenne TaxID=4522 RepID=UPI003A99A142